MPKNNKSSLPVYLLKCSSPSLIPMESYYGGQYNGLLSRLKYEKEICSSVEYKVMEKEISRYERILKGLKKKDEQFTKTKRGKRNE